MRRRALCGVVRAVLACLLLTLGLGKLVTPYVSTLAVPFGVYYLAMTLELSLGVALFTRVWAAASRLALGFFFVTVLVSILYDGDCG